MIPRSLTSRIERWSEGPEQSTRPVALMRIAIGLIVLTRFGSELALFRSLDPVSLVLGPLFFVLAAMMIAGYMARLATAGVAASIVEIYLTGGYGNSVHQWNHHHVYILLSATVLLALTPCDRSYSIDRYRALRDAAQGGPPAPPERGNLWAQRLIVLQLAALYFWTAYDKSDWAWISGQRLDQLLTLDIQRSPARAAARLAPASDSPVDHRAGGRICAVGRRLRTPLARRHHPHGPSLAWSLFRPASGRDLFDHDDGAVYRPSRSRCDPSCPRQRAGPCANSASCMTGSARSAAATSSWSVCVSASRCRLWTRGRSGRARPPTGWI